ncbi:MAG: hypothetical protein ACK4YP_20750, partial [Myxococcota bacterium]
AWTATQALTAGGLAAVGLDHDPVLGLAIATGMGVVATRPARVYLLPLVLVFVVAMTLVLAGIGFPAAVAAGAAAGIASSRGDGTARVEGMFAGVAGAGIGLWAADRLGLVGVGGVSAALWTGAIVGICTSQALVPGALRWTLPSRIPSPGRIQASLAAPYRPACMRAWQLDQSFDGQAPDRATRAGLAEVAAWVYRLALTLQQLDGDLARIDPISVGHRLDALRYAPVEEDAFIRERRLGTAGHLTRLLEHRAALALERARTESLQDYALAYLEEARAGLSLARVLPGEQTPEALGTVLDKLRAHAVESGARRQSAREIGMH